MMDTGGRIRRKTAILTVFIILLPIVLSWDAWRISIALATPLRPPRSSRIAILLVGLQMLIASVYGLTVWDMDAAITPRTSFCVTVRFELFSLLSNLFLSACLQVCLLVFLFCRLVYLALGSPLLGLCMVTVGILIFL